MSLQNPRVFAASFVTNASLTNAIDLGGSYLYVSIEVPGSLGTMFGAASTPIYVQGSSDNINFRRYTEILTATVANDFAIASSMSNRIINIPYFGMRYVKLEASATVTGGVVPAAFKIIASDSL